MLHYRPIVGNFLGTACMLRNNTNGNLKTNFVFFYYYYLLIAKKQSMYKHVKKYRYMKLN